MSKQIWVGVAIGVIAGTVLGIGSTFFLLTGKVAHLEAEVDALRQQPAPSGGGRTASEGTPTANPNDLVALIQGEQRALVRESSSEEKSQCFSEDDLAAFEKGNVVPQLVARLRGDGKFTALVSAIRSQPAYDRAQLLEAADAPLHQTWAQLGHVGRDGQTDAGQHAEKEIATAIVGLVRDLVRLPEGEFRRLERSS